MPWRWALDLTTVSLRGRDCASLNIAHDALDADAGEDRDFGADFLGQAAMDAAAAAGILAFGIFADEFPDVCLGQSVGR